MSATREITGDLAGAIGYTALASHGLLQWIYTLYSGTTAGLSLYYLIALAGCLACIQLAFWAHEARPAWQLGNACSLFNALMAIGAYWWVGWS